MTNLEVPLSGELLDIVDEFGTPTGQVADKNVIHAQGLTHRDVHVWVTNGVDFLQQQRVWDKDIMPGEWDISAAGHALAGETYLETARREVKEELGLEISADRFVDAGLFASKLLLPGWEKPHSVVGGNFAVLIPDLKISDLTLQASEVLGARWYNINRLEADLSRPETASLHAPQPRELYAIGVAAMRDLVRN